MNLIARKFLTTTNTRGSFSMTRRVTSNKSLMATLLGTTALVTTGGTAAAHDATHCTISGAPYSMEANTHHKQAMLNVGLAHAGYHALPGERTTFKTYWNYDRDVNQAEVRVFNRKDRAMDSPIATIPVTKDRATTWVPERGEYLYVLRVYDKYGYYDETNPRPLSVHGHPHRNHASETYSPGSCENIYRQDNTAVRNIKITGHRQVAPVVTTQRVYRPAPRPAPRVVQRVAPRPAPRPAPPPPAPKPAPPPARVEVYVEGEEPTPAWSVGHADMNSFDATLNSADIRLSYDGLEATPLLNTGLSNAEGTAARGETIEFDTYWNYDHWIERASISVFDPEDPHISAPIAVVPVGADGKATWTVPTVRVSDHYTYVLRVEGENGAFDETIPKIIEITDRKDTDDVQTSEVSPIYGNDATAFRNIKVRGGAVTVSGNNILEDGTTNVRVFGEDVPFDQHGDFAVQQILPSGEHNVDVSFRKNDGTTHNVQRTVNIPESDWFFVGLGDLTVGTRSDNARELIEASGDEFDDTFVHGRAAFYLKGKIKGEYLLTAALDTTEDDIDNIFSNLDQKNPRSLLRRLDPDRFYPVYGDDSTYVEDAPTQGRFYVRIERDDDHAVWGNFLTDINDTEFAQVDRGLYGGKVAFNSDNYTSTGESKTQITAFAADPGTIPAREEYRATGGSVYFVEFQDVTIGSERLRIEVRDRESGLVTEVTDLKPFVDYEFDYIQGRVLLARPLSATQLDNRIVRDGPLSGEDVFLVVRYEYQPGLEELDGWTYGGRAEQWVGDHARVAVTALQEQTNGVDQELLAGDVLLRASEDTYIKAEYAVSDGIGFGERTSADGGFTFDALTPAATDDDATAIRVEGAAALPDITGLKGRVNAYIEDLEAGFSGASRLTQSDTTRYGGELTTKIGKNEIVDFGVKYDRTEIEGALEETIVSSDLRVQLTDTLSAGIGARYSDVDASLVGRDGERLDGGVEVAYQPNVDNKFYVFGQDSFSRDDTRQAGTRYGGGAEVRVTEDLSVQGEVSGGVGGLGALAGVTWQREDGEEYYLNYAVDAERREPGVDGNNLLRTGTDTLTVGGRKRFNSHVSVYGEERASFGDTSGLTHAYGIDITPTDEWSIGGNVEIGDIEERGQVIEREAYTGTIGYADDRISGGVALEWRTDENNLSERETWLLRSNLNYRVNDAWRALLRFNKAESNASEGAFFDGEFTEAQIAGAYRSIDNDRFNALLRYTYFEDLPGSQQVSSAGFSELPAQKSNIFSIDGNYRLNDWLTIGGKYGYRAGEVSLTRTDEDFVDSTAQLGVVRADVHFAKKWDALLEGRILDVEAAEDTRAGALAAIYRHIGDNAKVGVGYNFTDFSDDLTDQSFNDDGLFLNIIAKF